MRVNVYSQEITDEVKLIEKDGADGQTFSAVQLMLHSSEMLHQPPNHTGDDDDRSAITLWLPRSAERREKLAATLQQMVWLVRSAKPEVVDDYHENTVDQDALISEIERIHPSVVEMASLHADGLITIGDGGTAIWVDRELQSRPSRFLFELLKALKLKKVSISWYREIAASEWFKSLLVN